MVYPFLYKKSFKTKKPPIDGIGGLNNYKLLNSVNSFC